MIFVLQSVPQTTRQCGALSDSIATIKTMGEALQRGRYSPIRTKICSNSAFCPQNLPRRHCLFHFQPGSPGLAAQPVVTTLAPLVYFVLKDAFKRPDRWKAWRQANALSVNQAAALPTREVWNVLNAQ